MSSTANAMDAAKNPVSVLFELCQKGKSEYRQPDFVELESKGPPNNRTFTFQASIVSASRGEITAEGQGARKQLAHTEAARNLLNKLDTVSSQCPASSASSASLPSSQLAAGGRTREEAVMNPPSPRQAVSQCALKQEPVMLLQNSNGFASKSKENQPPLVETATPPAAFAQETTLPAFSEDEPFETLSALCNYLFWTSPILRVRSEGSFFKAEVETAFRNGIPKEWKELSECRFDFRKNSAILAVCKIVYDRVLAETPMLAAFKNSKVGPVAAFREAEKSTTVQSSLEKISAVSAESDTKNQTVTDFQHILNRSGTGGESERVELNALNGGKEFDELNALNVVARFVQFDVNFSTYSRFGHILTREPNEKNGGEGTPYLRICTVHFFDSRKDAFFHGQGASQLEAEKDSARRALHYVRVMLDYEAMEPESDPARI